MKKTIVIDSSVAIKWVVPEEGTDSALAVRSEYLISAPDLIMSEMANILWKKHQRGEISSREALVAAEVLLSAGIHLLPVSDLMVHATELAMTLRHPAYDCVYLAAAVSADCQFLTADSALIRKLRQQRFDAVSCRHLLDVTDP